MLEDDDVDAEQEPMLTFTGREESVETQRDTFFSFGSTVSNQLFITLFLLSVIRWNLIFLAESFLDSWRLVATNVYLIA